MAAVIDLASARDARDLDDVLKWSITKGGQVLQAVPHNVNAILRSHPNWQRVVAFDAHEQTIVKLRAAPWKSDHAEGGRPTRARRPGQPIPWSDVDTLRLQAWILDEYGVHFGRDTVDAGLVMASEGNRADPPADYLEGLKWDGVGRLGRPRPEGAEQGDDGDESWLTTYLGVVESSDYVRLVGRWFLISAVARIMDPGCKVDHALVLEGTQGHGKSSAVEALFDPWFSDTPIDLASKDRFTSIQGVWGYELQEFDGFSRHEAHAIKAFATTKADKFRPPYARRDIQAPRRCVFIGTINPGREYLHDQTGGRRWWPVKCGTVDLPKLRADRDQLFAEAVAAYRARERWYPESMAEKALCGDEQAERRSADPWESKLSTWLAMQDKSVGVTVADALSCLGMIDISKLTHRDSARAGEVLRSCGWVPSGRSRPRRYIPEDWNR